MYKLSERVGGQWVEHSFAPVFALQKAKGDINRIVVGVPRGDTTVFEQLVGCLDPPYFILYILHTPRGEGEAGRYQSPEFSREQLHSFIARFSNFLSADGRFDIWAHSPRESATVIWDRHNQLFAYGPISRFTSQLRALGFNEETPQVPVPHTHHYRHEYDAQAREILAAFEWSWSPLQPEDEQLPRKRD